MEIAPRVSVVMAVHNEFQKVTRSVESVLEQEAVDLELVVVDDGSTDGSRTILHNLAREDPRVRLFTQENQGLTKALVRGCRMAKGEYIARQDAGDVSLPGRFRRQLEVLQSNASAALVCCGTRYMGPQGEFLYDVVIEREELNLGLMTTELGEVRGPSHHGSVMFRRDLYQRVGGYRKAFYFAQDLDLWMRLVEHGTFLSIPEVLYQVEMFAHSISGAHREDQVRTAELILEAARLRRSGASEEPVLERVRGIRPSGVRKVSRRDIARFHYFIGRCLLQRGRRDARGYFVKALSAYPLQVKSLLRLLQTYRLP